MPTEAELAKERAEARAEKARELADRRAQIQAEDDQARQREIANTARLKALRMERDETDRVAAAAVVAAAPAKAPPRKRKKPAA